LQNAEHQYDKILLLVLSGLPYQWPLLSS